MRAPAPERIQKVLARAGVGSRRQVEEWIKAGRLFINGTRAEPGAQLRPRDKVTLDGRPVRLRAPESDSRVVIYHRPSGKELIPAEGGESAMALHRLPKRAGRRWVPISPLPPNDSGLELLTSDGDLAQALMRRLHDMRVEFALRTRGELRLDQLERLKAGLLEDGGTIAVESIEPAGGEGFNRWYSLVVRGGRAREVHRLCAAAGVELSRLIRVALGPVKMDRSLARERMRTLGPGETAELYLLAEMTAPGAETARPRAAPPGRKRSSRPPTRRVRKPSR